MAIDPGLPARYEIRVLEAKHKDWARAIMMHSQVFHNPVWLALYPENKTRRLYDAYREVAPLVEHQVASGYSLGVFDKEYEFRRPESAATGGALYWDFDDDTVDGDTLIEQMDFPLVSIAMAFDACDKFDGAKLAGFGSVFPAYPIIKKFMGDGDKRDSSSWEAKSLGEVLMRNSTSTRRDYEGQGLMRKLAEYIMRLTAERGFRGMQIETLSDPVCKVWSQPPAPFKAEIVSDFHTMTAELVDDKGEKTYPLRPANQRGTRIYVTLR